MKAATKLSPEQRRALAEHPDAPLEVEDPDSHCKYVLVRMDVYERMQKLLSYDESEPDPREFYAAFYEAVKDDLEAPGMEEYDHYEPPRQQS